MANVRGPRRAAGEDSGEDLNTQVAGEVSEYAEVESSAPSSNGKTPPPGIPLKPRSDRAVERAEPASASICVPCLIARGAVLVVVTALLITMVVLEQKRKKAATK